MCPDRECCGCDRCCPEDREDRDYDPPMDVTDPWEPLPDEVPECAN